MSLAVGYDPADLIDREAITAWGRGSAWAHGGLSGPEALARAAINRANAMRCVLALGLLIALYASANAATQHHAKPRHFIVRPSQGAAVPPGWYKFPGYPPIPPQENRNLDPSNRGSG